jgi:hypothetical protein
MTQLGEESNKDDGKSKGKSKGNSNTKSKGGGQECPPHTKNTFYSSRVARIHSSI